VSIASELPRLYTESQVAEYLSVSVRTVKRFRRAGQLKYVAVGGSARFTDAQIRAFIQDQEKRATKSPAPPASPGVRYSSEATLATARLARAIATGKA
jgi:excisionase family DNA binding protein